MTKEIEGYGDIAKLDDEQQIVFGWAAVAEVDGETVVDKQGDYYEAVSDLEKAAYDYVLHSREGRAMHMFMKSSDLVESFVMTPDKAESMNIDPQDVPMGWWVGFKVHDDNVWGEIKKGNYQAFSIGGKGRRTEKEPSKPITKNEDSDMALEDWEEIEKKALQGLLKHASHNQQTHDPTKGKGAAGGGGGDTMSQVYSAMGAVKAAGGRASMHYTNGTVKARSAGGTTKTFKGSRGLTGEAKLLSAAQSAAKWAASPKAKAPAPKAQAKPKSAGKALKPKFSGKGAKSLADAGVSFSVRQTKTGTTVSISDKMMRRLESKPALNLKGTASRSYSGKTPQAAALKAARALGLSDQPKKAAPRPYRQPRGFTASGLSD